MAGAGVRLWLSGEIAYAADVNNYLMDQVIAVFADEIERDTAYGSGLPLSVPGGDGKPALSAGRFCFLLEGPASVPTVQYYDGSAWVDSDQFTIADGAITEAKLADNSVTSAKIAPGTVIAADISDNTVTEAKLTTSVAGNGLSGGNGTALTVNVDNSTIEINSDSLRLKDAGITSAKLGTSLSLTSPTLSGPTLSGTTSLAQVLETASVSGSALSGTVNLDALSGAVYYNTSSTTTGITLNLRGDGSNTLASVMTSPLAFTCVYMITSGSTAGKISSITIGSSTVSVKWFGGTAYPSGSGGGAVDVYTITAIKTNDAGNGSFTVFASQSKFA